MTTAGYRSATPRFPKVFELHDGLECRPAGRTCARFLINGGFLMTRSQIRQMVDELAEEVRTFVFQALDAEIGIQGEEAGQIASAIERAFRQQIHALFD